MSERCRPGSIVSSDSRNCRESQGQAAVELALVLPIIVLLLMMAIQVVLIGRDQVLVVHLLEKQLARLRSTPRPLQLGTRPRPALSSIAAASQCRSVAVG